MAFPNTERALRFFAGADTTVFSARPKMNAEKTLGSHRRSRGGIPSNNLKAEGRSVLRPKYFPVVGVFALHALRRRQRELRSSFARRRALCDLATGRSSSRVAVRSCCRILWPFKAAGFAAAQEFESSVCVEILAWHSRSTMDLYSIPSRHV